MAGTKAIANQPTIGKISLARTFPCFWFVQFNQSVGHSKAKISVVRSVPEAVPTTIGCSRTNPIVDSRAFLEIVEGFPLQLALGKGRIDRFAAVTLKFRRWSNPFDGKVDAARGQGQLSDVREKGQIDSASFD